MRSRSGRIRGAASALVVLAAGLVAGSAGPAIASVRPPNVVIVLSDDQPRSLFTRELMPDTFARLVDRGVSFSRGYVNTPVCCPSRAQLLTGQYGHHTGVFYNNTPLTRTTIVHALHSAGYRTMLAGKYLNSNPCTPKAEFDRWVCVGEGQSDYSLIDPKLNVDGHWKDYTGYQAEVLAGLVRNFVASTPSDQPFFVLYAPTAPHLPADDDRFADVQVPLEPVPSFDEKTRLHHKPRHMWRPAFSDEERLSISLIRRDMGRSVLGLDLGVGKVLDAIANRPNTIVFYLSDNGYLYGEHRRWDKTVPYEESVGVPFVIRYPPLLPREDAFASKALVSNVDVAATIADLAGVPLSSDGRSLVPLLTGDVARVRTALLIEHCRGSTVLCPGTGMLLLQRNVPGYWGVVTARYKYVLYGTGERELYDLLEDPWERRNRAAWPAYAQVRDALAAKLTYLRTTSPS